MICNTLRYAVNFFNGIIWEFFPNELKVEHINVITVGYCLLRSNSNKLRLIQGLVSPTRFRPVQGYLEDIARTFYCIGISEYCLHKQL